MIRFYMDQHVPLAVTNGLRLRGFDVLTAFEDGTYELPDPELLDRAGVLERILFTRDDDFLRETILRLEQEIQFQGVIYAHQLRVSIGQCVDDLELFALIYTLEELVNQVVFLPL